MPHAGEQNGKHAAAVAEGEAQTRMPFGDAAADHRRRREADVPGKAHGLLAHRADHAVLPNRPQRMHENRRPHVLGRGEERLEARIADGHAVDVGRDLDAGKLELADDILELAQRKVQVLQRHRA